MKLVEILAKQLSEWPEDAHVAVQDPDQDNTIWFQSEGHEHLRFEDDRWRCRSMFDILVSKPSCRASDYKTAIVTRVQWQAERDRQKGGEWKRHRGGAQPVDNDVYVEVHLRCGDIQQSHAQDFIWPHKECDRDANLTKYRIISQPQAEEVDAPKLSRLEARMLFSKPCIVYPESTEAKTGQIETPFKWRDEVTELNAYIEKYTRERDALIERLASEGFALIPPVVSVVSGFSGADMNDWRNWVAGDEVECVSVPDKHAGYFTVCESYSINSVDQEDEGTSTEIDVFCDSSFSLWCPASSFRFIRRP